MPDEDDEPSAFTQHHGAPMTDHAKMNTAPMHHGEPMPDYAEMSTARARLPLQSIEEDRRASRAIARASRVSSRAEPIRDPDHTIRLGDVARH